MDKTQIAKGIYYVGCKDWKLRDFHGFETPNGVTYNAYLIIDEKTCLIDTVKNTHSYELLNRIKEIIPVEKIDYVVLNHVENDHASSLPYIMDAIGKDKPVYITAQGSREAQKLYGDYNYQIVKDGDTLSLGENTMQFVPLPMLHWPDSMATYAIEKQILFSNDALGQHLCSSNIMDKDNDINIVMQEAQKYYANILLPYSKLINPALDKIKTLPIKMICPSHGVIWQKYINEICEKYSNWGNYITKDKILVIYDSMWGATECMAKAIFEGVCKTGVEAKLHKLGTVHNSQLLSDMLEASGVIFGSPTLNYGMMPMMGSLLIYLKGLKPKDKLAATFGAYGWSGGAQKDMEELLQKATMQVQEGITINWTATQEEFAKCEQFGFDFANRACKK